MDLKNPRQNSANFSHNNDCADVSMSKTGRACSHNASDNAACTQRPDCAPVDSKSPKICTMPSAGKKKNRKLLRVLGAGSLALIMGASVLCGVLFAPISGSAAASMTNQDNPATNLSAEAQAKAELDANLINSGSEGLGLDPENDPVIFTTETGIDIKFGAATLSSGALSGYAYVTMAGRNWVIIGQSLNGLGTAFSIPSYKQGWANSSYVEKATVAGAAIFNDTNFWDKAKVYGNIQGSLAFSIPNAVRSAELELGELLCISEKNIGNSFFNGEGDGVYSNDYAASDCDLRIFLANYYTSSMSSFEKKSIKQITLKTARGTSSSSTLSVHLFPLGVYSTYTNMSENSYYTSQNFCIETYLGTGSKAVSYAAGTSTATNYMLRTAYPSDSYHVFLISSTGDVDTYNTRVYKSYGVRPCFVLKLT